MPLFCKPFIIFRHKYLTCSFFLFVVYCIHKNKKKEEEAMSDVYYDMHMDSNGSDEERSTTAKVLSIIGKSVVACIVLLILFILFYRMWEMREPAGSGKYVFTAATLEAYEELEGVKTTVSSKYSGSKYVYEYESHNTVTLTMKGEDESKKEDYEIITIPASDYYSTIGFEIFTQRPVSYKIKDEDGKEEVIERSPYYEGKGPVEGALMVNHVYLVPAAKQVQLTFRYKNDVTKKLESSLLPDTGLPFAFTLTDDNNDYTSFRYKTYKKGVYRYVTMVFEGVDLSKVNTLTLEMDYYTAEEKETLSMCIYDSYLPVTRVKYKVSDPVTLPLKKD